MHKSIDKAEAPDREFSLPLFVLTLAGTLSVFFLALRLCAPGVWSAQFLAPFWKSVVVFLVVSLADCCVEYFFHRYILHSSAVPLLGRLYRQHTLHHGLTHIVCRKSPGGRGIPVIENRFPIVDAHQNEAAFFPWYSLAVFGLLACAPLTLLQWFLPSFPWFIAGLSALAFSLSLYEVLHAINHWPFERWVPLLDHPRWGNLWRTVYGLHLRHHAVIDSNESISGFLGLPLADWVFGTCVIPGTLYADGEAWSSGKFDRPRPVAFIRWLDGVAARTVNRRRKKASERRTTPDPVKTSVRGGMLELGAAESRWETDGGACLG